VTVTIGMAITDAWTCVAIKHPNESEWDYRLPRLLILDMTKAFQIVTAQQRQPDGAFHLLAKRTKGASRDRQMVRA